MKVAISLPDPVFHAAERLAREMKTSRSALYADAVSAYIASRAALSVREKLDAVYAVEDSRIDPAFERASAEILPDETW